MKNRYKKSKSSIIWISILLLSILAYACVPVQNIGGVFFALCALYIAYVFLNSRREVPCRAALRVCAVAAIVMGLGAYYGNIFGTIHLVKYTMPAILAAAFSFLLFLALFCDSGIFAVANVSGLKRPQASVKLLFSAFLALIIIVIYWKYYPYGESPDTANQWAQIHGMISYNKVHAIGHTIFLKALLSLWDNYTFVIIVQLMGVLVLYALFSFWFCSKGMNIKQVAVLVALCLIWMWPSLDAFFYPWKDLPAALCVGFITFFLVRLQEKETLKIPEAVALGLALAWTALFRLNGIIAAGVCGLLAVGMLWRRSLFPQIVAALLAVVISVAGVKLYTDRVLKPIDVENGFTVQVFASGISAAVATDKLDPKEEAAVEKVLPLAWMRENYNVYDKQPLIWKHDGSDQIANDPNLAVFNNEFVLRLGENKKDVVLLYLKLLPHHLPVMFKDLIFNMKIIWALEMGSFSSSHIFWLAVLLILGMRARLQLRDLLIFLPCFCNTVSIAVSTITNEVRYLLPSFLLLPFFLLYMIWKGSQRQGATN